MLPRSPLKPPSNTIQNRPHSAISIIKLTITYVKKFNKKVEYEAFRKEYEGLIISRD